MANHDDVFNIVAELDVANISRDAFEHFERVIRNWIQHHELGENTDCNLPNDSSLRHTAVMGHGMEWGDILLKINANDNGIMPRISRNDAYCHGFHDGEGGYEFKWGDNRLPIPCYVTPKSLGFAGNYRGLGQDLRRTSQLNGEALKSAVFSLYRQASTKPVNRAEREARSDYLKKGLIVIVEMVCEPVRYERILLYLLKHFDPESGFDCSPPEWMIYLQKNWARISKAILNIARDHKSPDLYLTEQDRAALDLLAIERFQIHDVVASRIGAIKKVV